MSAKLKSRFRTGAKICSGFIIILLLVAALGPAKWAPRTELGWSIRPPHWLFRNHAVFLLCLAATVAGRGNHYGRRGIARKSANFDTGSIS